jgi:hypothetical protein
MRAAKKIDIEVTETKNEYSNSKKTHIDRKKNIRERTVTVGIIICFKTKTSKRIILFNLLFNSTKNGAETLDGHPQDKN